MSFLEVVPISMMCILQVSFFLLLLFQFIQAAQDCSISSCRGDYIPVRFPFRLEPQQRKNCGYPGLNLRCDEHGLFTVLTLPYSGDFLVRNISYATQQLQLYDSDNCIVNRLLHFNLSGSPFQVTIYQNYTFLSCPKNRLTGTGLKIIDCLSNSTTSVLATSSAGLINSLAEFCEITMTRLVPVSLPVKRNEGLSTDLKNDIVLSWSSPNCEECEALGGICGFQGNDSQDVGCSYNRHPGETSKGIKVFRLVCLSIGVPIVVCAAGISAVTYFMTRSSQRNRAVWNSGATAVAPQPAVLSTGLDESTIESYEMLVLGDSKRVPGPNSSTCAICISEYSSKETLRCIPECHHCFHADCIDEWLRLNGTCPVCRNSPSPARATQ